MECYVFNCMIEECLVSEGRCLTPLLKAPEGDALEEDILALAQRSGIGEMGDGKVSHP